MKKRRADNENRDMKEALLIENVFSLISELFPKSEGAGASLNCFVYLSYSSEAPTDLLIEKLQEAGYRVFAPRIENGEMLVVEVLDDFTLSPMRIREPVGEPFEGELQLCITPLLAVDKKGARLGYGGGYYDRFFEKHKSIKKIGYAFDFQVLENVPSEPFDKRLDYTVTDKRVIKHEIKR
jgi:5-formyltetrahydrofolate cyclo-ligase